jgi:exodeoxyribonuclease VII small subunit
MSQDKVEKTENLEFEEALEELEGLVASLENRSTKLKVAMQALDRGKVLYELCASKLQEAENKLKVFEDKEGDN